MFTSHHATPCIPAFLFSLCLSAPKRPNTLSDVAREEAPTVFLAVGVPGRERPAPSHSSRARFGASESHQPCLPIHSSHGAFHSFDRPNPCLPIGFKIFSHGAPCASHASTYGCPFDSYVVVVSSVLMTINVGGVLRLTSLNVFVSGPG